MQTRVFGFALLLLGLCSGSLQAQSFSKNGFAIGNATIPPHEILSGGPAKDGIPALDQPKFLPAKQARYMKDSERVLGVVLQGEARAYPIAILNWHEIVNDRIGDTAFAVTFCPLCGTGMGFARDIAGKETTFGVSGLLYNSDVLLYDRETESLWSQILRKAISGQHVNTPLVQIPLIHTTWKDWLQRYPESSLLSRDTSYSRDYHRNPYEGYERSRDTYFKVSHKAPLSYHPKERVIAIDWDGHQKAYPFSELSKQAAKVVKDTVGGRDILIHWNEQAQAAEITDGDNKPLPSTVGFWFAWFTFYPETGVYSAEPEG